tara:strand:+ start:207 stop:701 length:495 start_codon:yes stop_codon:yes gene_type:complete
MVESAFGKEFEFSFTRERFEDYKRGAIHSEWFEKYPQLFDQDDYRIVVNQHHLGYHFFEMLSSILLYEATGFCSLLEKYSSPSHTVKHDRLVATVPRNLLKCFNNYPGEPDLFCYHPNRSDWFLAEVKGHKDIIRKNQRDWSQRLISAGGPAVRMILLKELPAA